MRRRVLPGGTPLKLVMHGCHRVCRGWGVTDELLLSSFLLWGEWQTGVRGEPTAVDRCLLTAGESVDSDAGAARFIEFAAAVNASSIDDIRSASPYWQALMNLGWADVLESASPYHIQNYGNGVWFDV